MSNQLIQDPNKLPSKNNEVSIKDIAEPISYFLAGGLLIWTILSPKLTNAVVLEPMEWFTVIVGALLMVAGFIALIIIPFQKLISHSKRMLVSKIRHHITAVVFGITLAALAIFVIGLHGYKPLYITGIVFLCIVALMIIILSWSRVFKNSVSLMTISISLNGMTIALLFAGATDTELATALGLTLFFLFLTLNSIAKRTTSS